MTMHIAEVSRPAIASANIPPEHRKKGFRPDIEGLRGIAVLLVVLYHASLPGVNGGYIGVDIFFVMSGYLITGLLLQEMRTNGQIHFLQFYARRARRLLPASAFVVLATLLGSYTALAPVEQKNVSITAVSTALYGSNLRFIHQKTDYLAADANNDPLLHTWSLAVEEQFYFVWPLLLWATLRKRHESQARARLYVVMVAMTILSFLGSWYLTRYAPPWAFFGSPARAWEFGLGALATLWNGRGLPRFVLFVFSLTGLAAILGASYFFTANTPFPGTAALLPVLGTALLLLQPSGVKPDLVKIGLSHPLLLFFGRVSYSWYLWHWPVLVLAGVVWNLHLEGRLICVLVSLLLAYVTHVLIENPVRFNKPLAARPGLSIGLAASVTLISVGLCGSLYFIGKRLARSPQQVAYTRATDDLPIVDRNGCSVGYSPTENPPCVFGDTGAATTVVLLGDSHAGQWFPALDRIAVKNHWKLISWTKSACPVASLDHVFDRNLGRDYAECKTWRSAVIRRVEALHPSAVVVSNFSAYYRMTGHVTEREWQSGLRLTLSEFDAAHIPVVLVRDPPAPFFDAPVCLARAAWQGRPPECGFTPDRSLRASIDHSESAAHESLPLARTVDVSATICPGASCQPQQEHTLLYRDRHHLTATYAASLAPLLETQIAAAVRQRR